MNGGCEICGVCLKQILVVDLFPLNVHLLPFLILYISLQFSVLYIPLWFPGAAFQHTAEKSRVISDYICNQPWELVLEHIHPT